MSLVPSLLQAIVRVKGEALVMHVGDKPYVVAPGGQVELASRGLTFDAVNGILTQLLPPELRNALDECGAVQYVIPPAAEFPGETFTVVAARGGDDVWAEVRRRLTPSEDLDKLPDELFQAAVSPAARAGASAPPAASAKEDLELPRADQLWSSSPTPASAPTSAVESSPPPAAPAPPEVSAEGEPAAPAEHLPPLAEPQERTVLTSRQPTSSEPRPAAVQPPPAVVLPLARSAIRGDVPPIAGEALTSLDRLLRLAAARGASTLYLSSAARPSVRVDGDVQTIDGAPVLGPSDVESLLLTLIPERNAEALRTGVASEWICEVADVGRVRCLSFRDHLGPGGVFRMMPTRVVTADQLGLSREVQGLALEPEGLLIVAGPRGSGKRTLIAALVDLVNRTRRDHVITVEREINVVHDRVGSLISQREVRGGGDDMVAVARAALREDPDVIVLEDLRTAALMSVALEAAASGRLVIGGFPAHSASSAVDRIIDLHPAEQRRQVQLSLAQHLRGVIAQVLLRKGSGGRVAAREVLLNTPAVRSVLAEGKTSQLPLAIEGGRQHGMVPLNDALAGLVQSGVVDVREAHRRAADRPGFLAALKRQGFDTSFVERLA